MAVVTYDDRSLMIDASRVWLTSGSLHYFRVPAALWRDRLLKAKRCGLNCISTFIPWNFHQPSESQWDLTGDHDVVSFVKLAGEMGLYVILKPGPFIGADWDFGGLPPWLTTKTGIGYRNSNAAYTHYFDRYFRQVLPRLADLQVTHNGTIILIQNENEYVMTTMPDRRNYLEFVSQLFRRSGFDIPIISSNMLTEPEVGDSIETVGVSHLPVRELSRLRRRQDRKPMVACSFGPQGADCWGKPAARAGAEDIARRLLEIIGCGAQYDYHMWHGGTNFGFNAGRLSRDDSSFITTSCSRGSVLDEGGCLTRGYYLTKLVNMFSTCMGPQLASCRMQEVWAGFGDAPAVLTTKGYMGSWIVVTNNGNPAVQKARVWSTDSPELEVPLDPLGAVAIPVNVELTQDIVLNYANVMPLGFWAKKLLVFHGPAGWAARICINGNLIQRPVPRNDDLATVEHEGMLIILMNSVLAMRVWDTPEGLVVGPKYAGQGLEEIEPAKGSTNYVQISFEGKISRPKCAAGHSAKAAAAPRLTAWKHLAQCAEPADEKLEWQQIAGPRDVDHLGAYQGYVWYQVQITQPKAAAKTIFMPECGDRATIFLNGKRIATWGVGDGAARKPISVQLRKGVNVLTMLVDNLGRFCDGPNLGELKGVYGHVYSAKPMPRLKFKLTMEKDFARKIVPRSQGHVLGELDRLAVWSAKATLTLTKVAPVHVSITAPHTMALLCNDRPVLFAPITEAGKSWAQLTLGSELRAGKNELQFVLWGDVKADSLKDVVMHLLAENLTESARWSWRQWALPRPSSLVKANHAPCWFTSSFRLTENRQPLFLELTSGKGQVFVNGHNCGRFWSVGPQTRYYLPSCWLKSDNEIVLFEESGKQPQGGKLLFAPVTPTE